MCGVSSTLGNVQSGCSPRQRLQLVDVERRAGDLAGLQRCDQVIQPGRHAAADVDEERRPLHALEAGAVEEAFGRRRMRHRQDHEIRARQQLVQGLRRMQLGHPAGRRRAACIGRQHGHAESREQARGLGTDAAQADDQGRRFGQMHDIAGLHRALLPLAAQLLRNEHVQPAGKGQHECQDVGADMVVVDLTEVRDAHRMADQLGIVVAGRRRRLGRLQPAQVRGLRQELLAEPAEGCFRVDDLARGGVRRPRQRPRGPPAPLRPGAWPNRGSCRSAAAA